jgi:hypothetical protein
VTIARRARDFGFRQNPQAAQLQWFSGPAGGGQSSLPLPVKVLQWAFVTNARRDFFCNAPLRMFGGTRQS